MELITDSETLRKIQVKHGHGLAGSFRDRSIAEWLQTQNPTELDYQKVSIVVEDLQTLDYEINDNLQIHKYRTYLFKCLYDSPSAVKLAGP